MSEVAEGVRKKSRIIRFEDLIAWQKSRALTKEIYIATSRPAFAKDFGLRDQIRRAAVSVMSNIAEGYERRGRAEFHHFLSIAKSSCAEVRSQLYVAHDVGYLQSADFDRLFSLTDESSRIIGALKASVRPSKSGA